MNARGHLAQHTTGWGILKLGEITSNLVIPNTAILVLIPEPQPADPMPPTLTEYVDPLILVQTAADMQSSVEWECGNCSKAFS
jgi:hypothetical protein